MSNTTIGNPNAAPAVSSRLVQSLASLTDAEVDISHKNFVEKLARLVDLSEAISLSETLRALRRMPKSKLDGEVLNLKDLFLNARRERVEFIGRSFGSVDDDVPFILPTPGTAILEKPEESFQAYQRFYSLHQSEMEHGVLQLRGIVRQQLAARSARLARLAALDQSVGDTLMAHNRGLLARISAILARRFFALVEHNREIAAAQSVEQWAKPGGWLNEFYREMQGLLLAELEVRLLPVLGLVEAADSENEPIEIEKSTT